VFLAADYDAYVINDANPDLVAMWAALQARPRKYISRAAELFCETNHSREAYIDIRAQFNSEMDAFERAVLLPYLNRFGFNGLWRVNSSGQFNVPYGQSKVVPKFPWDAMEAASRKLHRCLVLNGGYRGAIDLAGEGDVVYCDPPYVDDAVPSFTQYTSTRFGMSEQQELVRACECAVDRGATVLISNHDTPTTRELYAGWHIETVCVRRSIAATADARGLARELVACLSPGCA